jgi:hypothetical protein
MGVKGRKSRRGVGDIYTEAKSVRRTILLTPTANNLLIAIATNSNISTSEAIERWLRAEGAAHDLAE